MVSLPPPPILASLGRSEPVTKHRPRPPSHPYIAGTVLIDVFDTPPRPRPSSPLLNRSRPSQPPADTEISQLPHIPSPTPDGQWEIIGGGAVYALIGARLWLPPASLRTLVDRSRSRDDFPKKIEAQLNKLAQGVWVFNENDGTKAVRAAIGYIGDQRSFTYLVPPPQRSIAHLIHTPLYGARYLHLVESPERISTLLQEIKDPAHWTPRLIYEPHPLFCTASQVTHLERILPALTVLSPNHEELFSMYSLPRLAIMDPQTQPAIERLMRHLLDVGIGPNGDGIIVVRCGRLGACVGTRRGGLRWIPAFFEGDDELRVRDVTGAGNAFLGGYAAGLALTDEDAYEACLYGTVSASFVVEQFGLPVLSTTQEGGQENEVWNNEVPLDRVDALRRRLQKGPDGHLW
ncbi:hypothetical protein P7C73_g3117, partial [Tremellales sp. Uapishka_1]